MWLISFLAHFFLFFFFFLFFPLSLKWATVGYIQHRFHFQIVIACWDMQEYVIVYLDKEYH